MLVRLEKPRAPGPLWLLFCEGEDTACLIFAPPELDALMPERAAWFEAARIPGGWRIVGRVAAERRRLSEPRAGGLRRSAVSTAYEAWRPST